MSKPKNESNEQCPLWQKAVAKVCHLCPWYTLLRGKNPQTGVEVDEWGCAVAFLPILLIENAKETRQGAAAIESFRNDVVKLQAVDSLASVQRLLREPPLNGGSTREV